MSVSVLALTSPSLTPKKTIAVGIVGPGLVGGELMRQLEATQDSLAAQGLDVCVSAISELKKDASGTPQGWMICTQDKCTYWITPG